MSVTVAIVGCGAEKLPRPAPETERLPMSCCEGRGELAVLRYLRQDWCAECAPGEEELHTGCSICGRDLDMAERALPLCDRCEGVARAHARLESARLESE